MQLPRKRCVLFRTPSRSRWRRVFRRPRRYPIQASVDQASDWRRLIPNLIKESSMATLSQRATSPASPSIDVDPPPAPAPRPAPHRSSWRAERGQLTVECAAWSDLVPFAGDTPKQHRPRPPLRPRPRLSLLWSWSNRPPRLVADPNPSGRRRLPARAGTIAAPRLGRRRSGPYRPRVLYLVHFGPRRHAVSQDQQRHCCDSREKTKTHDDLPLGSPSGGGGFTELSGIVFVPVSAAIAQPMPATNAIVPVAVVAMPSWL